MLKGKCLDIISAKKCKNNPVFRHLFFNISFNLVAIYLFKNITLYLDVKN